MDWNKAQDLIDKAQRLIVLTHISPDGDAIGTMLGLGHALINQGKTVMMAVDEGVPAHLRFLPGADLVQDKFKKSQKADLVIAVDCSDESRMGEVGKSARALKVPLIEIDHHRSNTLFGDVDLVEPTAAAAAECVLDLLEYMHLPVTPEIAQCLLCGLVTDTLCFRTDSTTAVTLAKAQRLMERGADLSYIVQRTVSRMSTNTLRLWAVVFPTIQIEDHVVWVKISLAARKAANGAGGGDTKDGGLASLILQADDAYVSCVMHEKANNQVELSFRADPGFDVASGAVSLGGGGHMLAAGATVNGALDEVEARVIPLLKEAVKAGTRVV